MSNNVRRGTHFASAPRSTSKKKPLALVIASIALAVGVVGGTIAYIVDQSSDVQNTFEPGAVMVSVQEDFNGTVKKDVTVLNDTESVPAFVRAMVVVNWLDAAGNYYVPQANEDFSYTISLNSEAGWKQVDGYWYHLASVPADKETAVLVDSCSPVKCPKGYKLKVDVIVDAIQAEGTLNGNPVATEVWGVAVGTDTNGNLCLNI